MTIYKTLNIEKPHMLPENQNDEATAVETSHVASHVPGQTIGSEFYDDTDVMKSPKDKVH